MSHDFDVDRIIGRRISLCNGTEYLILWERYTVADATWEPSNNLDCDKKIEEFEQRCFQLRLEQQPQPDQQTVDQYQDHGLVTLVDEGHRYMAEYDPGFQVPVEDFDFVGDGDASKNNAATGKVRAISRDQAVGTSATHGWHRMRPQLEAFKNSYSPTLARSHTNFEPLSAPTYSSFLLPSSHASDPALLAEITRICGTIRDNGGRIYYLVQWSDQALSWETPPAFITQKEVELLTHFVNLQYAQERKVLGKDLEPGLTDGKVGLSTETYATKSGMGRSSKRAGDSGDAARWFNLKSCNLAPIVSTSPPAAMDMAGRHISDTTDEGSSSPDSERSLVRAIKQSRIKAPTSVTSATSESGIDTPLSRRMARLCSPKSVVHVFIDHREGETLRRHGVSRSASKRIERERHLAMEIQQRAVTAPTPPKFGASDVVARGHVVRIIETPPATPAPRLTERRACCVCQLDTRADAWGCVECGLWFHHPCYRTLATRLGADSEYLDALDDYDESDDFVCRFCSLHSRRTPQDFLTWRGAAPNTRVNMAAVDYLVKWRGVAYRHLDWVPFVWLQAQPEMRQKCMALKVKLGNSVTEPPRVEDTFEQDHLIPAAIIGVKPCTPDIARQRLAKMRENPPVDVPEDSWGLHMTCESVWVVWRGLGASEATWEAPPSPNDAGSEYCAWQAEYVAWQQAESVSLLKHLQLAKSNKPRPFYEHQQQPDFIRGGTLYPYQMEGANWLWHKWNLGQSVVLADEMGLGKTVQVISFLLMIYHSSLPAQSNEPNRGTFPFLIVAPTTLISNWAQELRTWAPGLVVAQLSGRAADREIELEHTIFRRTSGAKHRDLRCHVVLASYEAVANQSGIRELTTGIDWQTIVYDEGHRLKNDQAKTYKALSVFSTRTRVVLTGTPLQNDLSELSNILSFIDPDNKDTLSKLKVLYRDGAPVDVARIHSLIYKYFLRRTKNDVPCLVPAKYEVIVPVSMTCLQRELYRATLSKNVRLLQSIAVALHRDRPGGAERVGSKSLNNVLMEVRQIVSHPYLLANVEPKFDSEEEERTQLIAACGKLRFLHALLPELQRRGHRVLLFSQFKGALSILEEYLTGEGIGCVCIDGDTPSRLRQAAVNQFNAPGSPLLVFLASTRTGGTGLNLTSADVVIIYDCDFNPQADIQAIGRAHRIGQRKPVTVMKLVTENSAEERIVRRATRKLLLNHLVIDNLAPETSAAVPAAVLPQAETEAALRCDARTLFDESAESQAEKSAIVYDSQRVVALLDQCQVALAEEKERLAKIDSTTRSPFSVTRVWAMDRDGRVDDVAKDPAPLNGDSPESGAADVWARLLEKMSVVPADGDAEMADAEGNGPRLRARKQKVDYAAAVTAEDAAEGDDSLDAGDDEYVDVPSLPDASVTIVPPNELADVVMAHINGLIENYRANFDNSGRTANWDEQLSLAFKDLCTPTQAMSDVQWSPPTLLFSMPTDLRLPRGAQLPPQPKLYEQCPLCRGPSHGTGYCPRICDPRLVVCMARVKNIQGYWAHTMFHNFVCWYSFQYIWFVLGDPRGPAVNESNARKSPTYVCSAESYCREIRMGKEAARFEGIRAEADRRATIQISSVPNGPLNGSTRVVGELAVDICRDVSRDSVEGSAFNPFALDGLDCRVYTQFLSELRSKGHDLPTNVAALGPEHLPALLAARSKIQVVCLQVRNLAQKLMDPHARRLVSSKLQQLVEVVRLLTVHGRLIDGRIEELRAMAPVDGDVDMDVVDTAVDQSCLADALVSMDVDEPVLVSEQTVAAEVPEPSATPTVFSVASTETCSDSVVPSSGQFDEDPSSHGVRLAVGKLFQAQCLMAASSRGEEPDRKTKQALLAAISDARSINLRELLKVVHSRPQLHGLIPMVRRLTELEADPGSAQAKNAEMTSTLRELVLWVKTNIRDVESVVPTPSGYRVDITLADRPEARPLGAGVVEAMLVPPSAEPVQLVARSSRPPSSGAAPIVAAPSKTNPMQGNSPNAAVHTTALTGTAQTPPAVIAPSSVSSQRTATQPVRVVASNSPAALNTAAASSLYAQGAAYFCAMREVEPYQPAVPNVAIASRTDMAARSSTPSLPSALANSRPPLAASTSATAAPCRMSISPPQQVALPVVSSSTTLDPTLAASTAALTDSRRGSIMPNVLGIVRDTSPPPPLQPPQQPAPMSAPLGGQAISITSSPDNSPPLQQQPQQQHYQQRPMFGGSVSEIPLRATDVNANFSPVTAGAGWVAPPVATLLRPSPQSSAQSTVERARPSTGDLALGLAQGYYASVQSAPLTVSRQVSGNMQQGGLRNEQLQQYHMQQAEMQRMAERHRYSQQVAMMAQGVAQGVLNQQPQAQYYQAPATQLITPVSGNYEGQLSVDNFNRQMAASNAQWQMVQYPAGPRGPPMYLERMNGFVSASDMACVLCEDPVHPSSSCPLANNISHLNRRRVAVEESTTLPPNMREMMLITIDNYMKKALNQR